MEWDSHFPVYSCGPRAMAWVGAARYMHTHCSRFALLACKGSRVTVFLNLRIPGRRVRAGCWALPQGADSFPLELA